MMLEMTLWISAIMNTLTFVVLTGLLIVELRSERKRYD